MKNLRLKKYLITDDGKCIQVDELPKPTYEELEEIIRKLKRENAMLKAELKDYNDNYSGWYFGRRP